MLHPYSNGGSIRQTIAFSIQAPGFQAVSIKRVVNFKIHHEFYKKHIKRKNRELNSNVHIVSYKASIVDADLHLFIGAGWIEASSIENITEEKIVQVVESQEHRLSDGEHLCLLNYSFKPLHLKMNIFDAIDQVWTFNEDSLTLLEAVG